MIVPVFLTVIVEPGVTCADDRAILNSESSAVMVCPAAAAASPPPPFLFWANPMLMTAANSTAMATPSTMNVHPSRLTR